MMRFEAHMRSLSCGLFTLALLTVSASAGGSSEEDLVGIFSMQKSIQLGGSSGSSCSGGSCKVPDYLAPAVRTDPMADDQPPSLAGLSLEPGAVKGREPLDLTIHVIDDQTGLGEARALFRSPTGRDAAEVLFSSGNRTEGGAKDGFYSGRLVLPDESEKGDWLLQQVTLSDRAGNSRVIPPESLANLGLRLSFRVN
jgi:hypothetical protein